MEEVSALQVKKELKDLHLIDRTKTQRWLLREVRKIGFPNLYEPHFSDVLNGIYIGGNAPDILLACYQVLKGEQICRKDG